MLTIISRQGEENPSGGYQVQPPHILGGESLSGLSSFLYQAGSRHREGLSDCPRTKSESDAELGMEPTLPVPSVQLSSASHNAF